MFARTALSVIIFLPLVLHPGPEVSFGALDAYPLAWRQVNTPGFGEHAGPYTGQEAFELTVFNGRLYVGMEGVACARVWRLGPGGWEQVVSNGFDGTTDCAVTPATTDNDHIDSLEPFGDYLYASTAMQAADKRGAQVWRSPTGDTGSWEQVNRPGFGDGANENFKDMVVFQGLLCGGTRNDTLGAEVWCADGVTRDGESPHPLLWTLSNTPGFGAADNRAIMSSAVHGGALYVGVESGAGTGSVWRTRDLRDPNGWEQVFSAGGLTALDEGARQAVRQVDVLASFAGALYVGFAVPDRGEQVWRSASGGPGDWERVITNGFGSRTSGRFTSDAATVFGGALYVATSDRALGTTVWRTPDGLRWAQVSPPGFGSAANFAAQLQPFDGALYAWTSNYEAGQGVWRGAPNGN